MSSQKPETFAAEDKLNSRLTLNGKGLAGYVQTKSWQDARPLPLM